MILAGAETSVEEAANLVAAAQEQQQQQEREEVKSTTSDSEGEWRVFSPVLLVIFFKGIAVLRYVWGSAGIVRIRKVPRRFGGILLWHIRFPRGGGSPTRDHAPPYSVSRFFYRKGFPHQEHNLSIRYLLNSGLCLELWRQIWDTL